MIAADPLALLIREAEVVLTEANLGVEAWVRVGSIHFGYALDCEGEWGVLVHSSNVEDAIAATDANRDAKIVVCSNLSMLLNAVRERHANREETVRMALEAGKKAIAAFRTTG